MKRSKEVNLTILLSIIGTVNGCDQQTQYSELKHCVDSNGVVVEEDKCPHDGSDGTPIRTGSPGHIWYYGGSSTPLSPGARPTGGSTTPAVGRSYSPPSVAVSRGGFGATGGAHGGGAGVGE